MRSIIRTLVTFLVLVLPGGCLSEHPLKVGSNQWPGYEPVYLARDLGLLSSDQVKLVELPSSTDVMQYLRNGLLDAGMLTLDETISLINDGVKLDVVLVMGISDGADSVLAQQDIRSPADIKGQKVGVELNAVGAVMLNALLEAAQLPRDSVRVVNTPVDQSIQAFRQRKIDVLITFEPFHRELLSGGAHEIFNSRRIPGAIIDVLVVRHDALQHHSGHLKELISAYFSARRHMKSARGCLYPNGSTAQHRRYATGGHVQGAEASNPGTKPAVAELGTAGQACPKTDERMATDRGHSGYLASCQCFLPANTMKNITSPIKSIPLHRWLPVGATLAILFMMGIFAMMDIRQRLEETEQRAVRTIYASTAQLFRLFP